MAWQAMHLLNEVLPAATSCASAVEAMADDAMTTSALRVSFFMGCSSWVRVNCGPCRMGRLRGTSRETRPGFIGLARGLRMTGICGARGRRRATPSGPDVLDL